MTIYFVSRHAGAVEWARRHGPEAKLVSHLDASMVETGDIVQGTLPIHEVAALNERGVRYFHLEMKVSEAQRGVALSADDMERLGARLVEYEARRCAAPGQAASQVEVS